MTDDRDPNEPRAPDDHPGVVEAIREEIEEVVEHVPQPVRWTVGKIVRFTLLALAALVVLAIVSAALYLGNRTELVAHELTLVLNQALARHTDVTLQIGDVKGNPLTGIRVLRPRVVFRDGRVLLAAPEMRVGYSLPSLVRGGRVPVAVSLVNPDIRLIGPDGRLRLPAWRGGGGGGGGGRELDVDLEVRGARIHAPAPLGEFQDLDLEAGARTGPVPLVEVRRLTWRSGPWGSRLRRFSGELAAGADSVRFRLRELRTDDLQLSAKGAWGARGGPRGVHAELAHVRWAWLAKVFDNDSFDVPGEGAAVVDARGDSRWSGAFTARLDWDSLAVEAAGRGAWDGRRLALEPLAARSGAGDLNGDVRWGHDGWSVGGDARDANPARWHALHLDGWPAGRLNGRFRYQVDTRRPQSTGLLLARLTASEWTGWRVDSAAVRVDFPPGAPDSFAVSGWRRGGAFTLLGRTGRGGWGGPYTLVRYPLDEWPDGRASGLTGLLTSGAGRVDSRDDGLHVTGTLTGAATTWSAAHFAEWRLDSLAGVLLPQTDLTARLQARDGTFTGVHLDSLASPLHVAGPTVVFGPARAVAGDTLLAFAGNAAWDADSWRVLLTQASATSSQFAWTAEPPVRIAGDRLGVVFERLAADDAGAHLEAAGRWAAPGGAYDFALRGRGLDLSRLGLPPDWGLGGRADAALVVSGRAGDPRWTFDAAARAPAFQGHAGDSLALSLGGAAHRLDVRALDFRLGPGTLHAAGSVEGAPRAWPDSLTATAVVRWLQDAASWQGSVEAKRLPLDGLGAFAPAADGWGGTLDGTLRVAGSPGAPRLDLEAAADRFGWRDYRAERVETSARYRDGRLEVPETRVRMANVVSTARGEMPLRLALGRPVVVPDEPLSWRIEVPSGDLQLLPLLVPQIQSARGGFDLTASLAGSARHPHLQGSGHIRDGTVRPINREEVLDHVRADLRFDEDRITLDTLTARQGRTGRVWGHGVVQLAGFGLRNYRFDLSLRDFAASEEGLYAMLFDGDFTVVDGPRVNGERLPQVQGNVRLAKGVIEFDFANQSEVQKREATTQPLYWTYHVHVDATNNLRWRPPDGDIEFNAALDLEQTPDSLLIFGEMHALRGTYYFLSNRFTIQNADLTFDNQKGVDPLLDITADTHVRPVQVAASAPALPASEDITVHITGRSSQPVIALSSSDPSSDQERILRELTYLPFTPGAGGSFTDPLDNYLTRQLNAQLSRSLSDFFQGAITEWEVQRDQGGGIATGLAGEGALLVGVGTQITPRIAFRYRQRVGADTRSTVGVDYLLERDVEAEYRLSRFIYLTTELAQHRPGQLAPANGSPNDFNVNLKARWEY